MKTRNSNPFRSPTSITAAFAVALFSHFAAPSAFALTYYWDNNGATAGFGNAAGIWAVPTTGSATQGWSQTAAGNVLPVNVTTTTSDTVNFGTGTLGLAAGTITVSDTVDAGNITYDNDSGNIILSGGTINLGAAATINNGGNTNTINSALKGAGTSLALSGGGTLIFTGSGTAGFGAGANATVSGGTTVRFSSGGHNALGGATGFNINLGGATTAGTLAIGNSGTVPNTITVVAGTGGRTLENSGSPTSMAFSGAITANESLSVENTGTGTLTTSGGGSSSIAAGKTVTYTASAGGDITNSALFGGSGAIAYTGSSAGDITVSGAKDYSGATTLGAMSSTGVVIVSTNSAGPANAPTSGAFGTGTVSIGATKMRATATADITVGNPITFSGNPTFSTLAGEKSLIFSGNASLGATRTVTVSTGSTVAGKFVRFGGIISGVGFGITKAGAGELRLSGVNSYSGATTITAGKLVGVVGGSNSSSTVNVNNVAATLGVLVANNTLSWTCSALTSSAAGILEFNFGAIAPSITVSPLIVTNAAAFTKASSVSVVVDAGLPIGTYPLMTWGTTSGTAPTAVTVSNLTPGTFASLSVSGNTLNLEIAAGSSIIIKEDNPDNLSLGTSWVGGVAPDSIRIAKWNNTVTSPNTTALGADVTWAGIAIENPTGLVTIDAGNTLTLGGALNDIDLSSADTAGLTLDCPLAMNGDNRLNVAASRTLTLGGQVSGAFDLTKLGAGTAILSSSANSYTGTTTVTAGTLQLGANNVIPNGAGVAGNVVVNGTLDLNGKSDSINGLSGSGVVDNTGAATSAFTVGNNAQTTTFSGVIKNTTGIINFTKTGAGTLTLSGANTFTGTTAVISGALVLANASALSGTSGISLSGGTRLTPDLSGLTINKPITLGATGTQATITAPDVDGSGTTAFPVTLSSAIGGLGGVIFSGINTTNGYGNINLNAVSNYAGSTLITTTAANNNAQIFVNLGIANALPITTVLTLDGGDGTGGGRTCEFDLNGRQQTIGGLTNVTGRTLRTQQVVNSGALATLTVNNPADHIYTARIGGGTTANNVRLTKNGVGKLTLTGANTYTGITTISGGTLALGASNVLAATDVSIGAGTLSIGSGFTDTVGTLNVTGAATINLGNASSKLAFADSSSLLTWAGDLTIEGPFVPGNLGSLRFGITSGGLTAAQLLKISATGWTGFGLDTNGFLTATEAAGFSSWIAGTFAGGATVPLDKRGPNDDFDNDGIRNLVEYAVAGQDPTVSNATIGSFTANTLSFTKRAGTSGITYAIQDSTDLGIIDTWAEVTGVPPVYVNDATTISYTLTPGAPAKNFIRLQVISD